MSGKSLVSALLAGGFSQPASLASWRAGLASELGWAVSVPGVPASWLGLAGQAAYGPTHGGSRGEAHPDGPNYFIPFTRNEQRFLIAVVLNGK